MPTDDEHTCTLPPTAAVGVLIVCSHCGQRWLSRRNIWTKLRWFHLGAHLKYGITIRSIDPRGR